MLYYAAKKSKNKKSKVLSLGEFLGDEAANVVTTSSSWADEVEQQADGNFASLSSYTTQQHVHPVKFRIYVLVCFIDDSVILHGK